MRIENFLSFWLGVLAVNVRPPGSAVLLPDEDAGLEGQFAESGLLSPCKTGFIVGPFFTCVEPGAAAWVARFCAPGTIELEFGFTGLSYSILIIDVLIGPFLPAGIGPFAIIELLAELQTVPKFKEALDCLRGIGTNVGKKVQSCSVRCASTHRPCL